MTSLRVAAVDLGATSGRVMVGEIGPDELRLEEVHRFPNAAVRVGDSLHWDVLGLHRELLTGLRLAARSGPLDGIGIDSWAVDYGLLDAGERLLGNPYSHRDARTDGVAAQVLNKVDAAELYAVTGIQQLPFNTIYQLVASSGTPQLEQAATLLLLPDLLGFWLTGRMAAERTNASTTGLYDVRTGHWATELADRVGVPSAILPPLRAAGEVLGPLLPAVAAELGVEAPVIAVGSHDTASAVVAAPMGPEPSAYISSGTWSLVGLELDGPVLTEAARLADFTNEVGVDGTIRFLKNVTGLWVLSESMRAWSAEAVPDTDLASLLAAAAEVSPLRTLLDINDPLLLPPGGGTTAGMPERVAALAAVAGEPVPDTPGEIVRCILDSLALAYRRNVRLAGALAGRAVEVVHVVGGGARNDVLCQLTADACEVPVMAGPAEASTLGNVLVQARTLGADLPDLAAMRALVRRTHRLTRFEPRADLDWVAAEARLPPERR